jgi:NAD(P)H dehydrogenase (quinone)
MIGVTGGNGQLGRHIVHALHALIGPSFIVTVRDTNKAAELSALGIKVRSASFDEPSEFARAIDGGDTLLVMSTLAPQDARIRQYRAAADAAKLVGISRIAFVGYLADQADSPQPSAISIHAALEYFKEKGYSPTNFRCGNYAEAGLATAQSALLSGRIAVPAGTGRISYVSRHDLGQAIAKVLTQPESQEGNIALTGPAAYSSAELAAFLTRISGRTITYEDLTPAAYEGELAKVDTPAPFIAFRKMSFEETRRGLLSEVSSAIFDITGTHPTDGLAFIGQELRV